MTDMTASPTPASQEVALAAEDEGYYHESALNAAWTGSRLAIGGLTFLFGAFAFAYFYLRSLNSSGRWQGSGYVPPSLWMGTTIMLLAVLSAGVHYFVLQRIKAGQQADLAGRRADRPGPRPGGGRDADLPAGDPAVPAGQLRVLERLRRFLPGFPHRPALRC